MRDRKIEIIEKQLNEICPTSISLWMSNKNYCWKMINFICNCRMWTLKWVDQTDTFENSNIHSPQSTCRIISISLIGMCDSFIELGQFCKKKAAKTIRIFIGIIKNSLNRIEKSASNWTISNWFNNTIAKNYLIKKSLL